MAEIVERFEEKARLKDESEAELIREKLEQFVTNILAEVEKRDKRFQSTLSNPLNTNYAYICVINGRALCTTCDVINLNVISYSW